MLPDGLAEGSAAGCDCRGRRAVTRRGVLAEGERLDGTDGRRPDLPRLLLRQHARAEIAAPHRPAPRSRRLPGRVAPRRGGRNGWPSPHPARVLPGPEGLDSGSSADRGSASIGPRTDGGGAGQLLQLGRHRGDALGAFALAGAT